MIDQIFFLLDFIAQQLPTLVHGQSAPRAVGSMFLVTMVLSMVCAVMTGSLQNVDEDYDDNL